MRETIGIYDLVVTTSPVGNEFTARWSLKRNDLAGEAAPPEDDVVGPYPTEVLARETAREAGRARVDALLEAAGQGPGPRLIVLAGNACCSEVGDTFVSRMAPDRSGTISGRGSTGGGRCGAYSHRSSKMLC